MQVLSQIRVVFTSFRVGGHMCYRDKRIQTVEKAARRATIPVMKNASESVIWGEQVIPHKRGPYKVHQWQIFLLQMFSTPFSKASYYSRFPILNITIFIPNSPLPTLYDISHSKTEEWSTSHKVQSQSSDLCSLALAGQEGQGTQGTHPAKKSPVFPEVCYFDWPTLVFYGKCPLKACNQSFLRSNYSSVEQYQILRSGK